ncbi:hypothetical protein ACFQL4_01330 [Halosimplex aquaticum]
MFHLQADDEDDDADGGRSRQRRGAVDQRQPEGQRRHFEAGEREDERPAAGGDDPLRPEPIPVGHVSRSPGGSLGYTPPTVDRVAGNRGQSNGDRPGEAAAQFKSVCPPP